MRLAFAGTPPFAAEHLKALIHNGFKPVQVLTQPDRPAGRGKRLTPSAVKAVALDAGLPVLQPTTLKSDDAQSAIESLELDVLVVVAYGLILPQAVLDLPKFGCLNVHGSVLPRWRGAAPIQRSIEAGDRESGVTIMQMEAGLDTGPMLAIRTTALTDATTSATLHDELVTLGTGALLDVLSELRAHLERATPQDDSAATYAQKITKAECLVDWAESSDLLSRKIRAFNPTPVCYSFLGGERVKIWNAQSINAAHQSEPGRILAASPEGLDIACGQGVLRVTEMQFPGGRALPISDLVNARSDLQPGLAFTAAAE